MCVCYFFFLTKNCMCMCLCVYRGIVRGESTPLEKFPATLLCVYILNEMLYSLNETSSSHVIKKMIQFFHDFIFFIDIRFNLVIVDKKSSFDSSSDKVSPSE